MIPWKMIAVAVVLWAIAARGNGPALTNVTHTQLSRKEWTKTFSKIAYFLSYRLNTKKCVHQRPNLLVSSTVDWVDSTESTGVFVTGARHSAALIGMYIAPRHECTMENALTKCEEGFTDDGKMGKPMKIPLI